MKLITRVEVLDRRSYAVLSVIRRSVLLIFLLFVFLCGSHRLSDILILLIMGHETQTGFRFLLIKTLKSRQ